MVAIARGGGQVKLVGFTGMPRWERSVGELSRVGCPWWRERQRSCRGCDRPSRSGHSLKISRGSSSLLSSWACKRSSTNLEALPDRLSFSTVAGNTVRLSFTFPRLRAAAPSLRFSRELG